MVAPVVAALLITLGGNGLPVRTPKAVGMSAERLGAIDRIVQRGVTAGGYPGAAVVVGRRGFSVFQKGFGHLGWTSDSPRVDAEETIYDLASLTKVVGTTTAAMILYDEGRLDLNAPVSQYLPAFSGGMKDSVLIRHLLTHYSGLPAGLNLWRLTRSPYEAKNVVLATQLICRPGQCFLYSDIGADVMGWVIEAITGQGLDTFLHERVFQPLGMNDTNFRPADSLQYRIAPTEVTPPRGYPLRGEVHDENAYALGGVAGHAGLFSSASDLAVFAQMLLNKGEINGIRLISDSTISLFTKRTAGTRALGWDTADGDGGSGSYLSERAFGHTGYTGTSMWIDPDREMFVILLTNRVHAARARRPSKVIADVRADLADAAAIAVMDDPRNVLDMPAVFRADRADGWNRSSVRSSRSGRSHASRKKTVSSSRSSAGSKAIAGKSSVSSKTTTPSTAKASGTKRARPKSATAKSKRSTASKSTSVRKAPTSARL
ncbi:MAG: serine hydrolase [Gemmatimonadaceae bacterium]